MALSSSGSPSPCEAPENNMEINVHKQSMGASAFAFVLNREGLEIVLQKGAVILTFLHK